MAAPIDSNEISPAPLNDVAAQAVPCATLDDVSPLTIVDDFASPVPIGVAELAAIETYLAELLDLVLTGS